MFIGCIGCIYIFLESQDDDTYALDDKERVINEAENVDLKRGF